MTTNALKYIKVVTVIIKRITRSITIDKGCLKYIKKFTSVRLFIPEIRILILKIHLRIGTKTP